MSRGPWGYGPGARLSAPGPRHTAGAAEAGSLFPTTDGGDAPGTAARVGHGHLPAAPRAPRPGAVTAIFGSAAAGKSRWAQLAAPGVSVAGYFAAKAAIESVLIAAQS